MIFGIVIQIASVENYKLRVRAAGRCAVMMHSNVVSTGWRLNEDINFLGCVWALPAIYGVNIVSSQQPQA